MWHHVRNWIANPSNSEQDTNQNKTSYKDQAKYFSVEIFFTS